MRFAWRLCGALAFVLVLAGCRMDVNVGVNVKEDGSGTVTVAVGADDDLLSRVPGATDRLHLDDLKTAGWSVTGPAKEADGMTWVHLSHPFGNPTEMKELLSEINGPGGPLHDIALTTRDEWDKTTWTLAGTASLAGGVDSFVDPDLATAFGSSKPLDQLIAESGVPLDEALNFTVVVQMPNRTAAQVTHVPVDGTAVTIRAYSEKVDQSARLAAIVAGVCGALLAGWLAYWGTRAALRVGRRRDAFTGT